MLHRHWEVVAPEADDCAEIRDKFTAAIERVRGWA
jgi:hypothetical protein